MLDRVACVICCGRRTFASVVNGAIASCAGWSGWRWHPSPTPANRHPDIETHPYLLRGVTIDRVQPMCRRATPTFRYHEVIRAWPLSWTGIAGEYRLGASPTRWIRASASRPCKKPGSPGNAGNLQHGPGLAVHLGSLHRRSARTRRADQHGWERPSHRQCHHRAALAQRQIQER